MKLTVYHGTSASYLDSIRKTGLGAKNIIDCYPNITKGMNEMINYLDSVTQKMKEKGIESQEWNRIKGASKAMADQKASYSHGTLFVTNKKNRAAHYATNNMYGSEILSRFARLYDLCTCMSDNKWLHNFGKRYHELNFLFNVYYNPPIVLQFSVDTKYLLLENGEQITDDCFVSDSASTTSYMLNKVIDAKNINALLPILIGSHGFFSEYQFIDMGKINDFTYSTDDGPR